MRLFADDSFYQQVEATKVSLIERYAEGCLPSELGIELERQAARSPVLRAEIDAAFLLQETRQRLTRQRLRKRVWPSLASLNRWKTAGYGMTAAFLILAAMLGIHSVMKRPLASPPSSSEATTSSEHSSEAKISSRAAAIIFLPRIVLRSVQTAPVVSLPGDATGVEIQAEVSPNAGKEGWTAELLSRGRTLEHWDHLATKSEREIQYLSISVRSIILPPGEYTIVLVPPRESAGLVPRSQRNFKVRVPAS